VYINGGKSMIEVIRKISDIKDIDQLIRMIEKQIPHHQEESNSNRILSSLENALSESSRTVLFLYLSEHKKYQGFVFANVSSGLESGGDYFWMNELYIDTPYRKQKIGSKLLEFIEKWCKENKLKYMMGITFNDNITAKAFYKSQGFELSDVTWISKKVE
jgi:GNAT superfamily N-acetyltransferase